MSTETAITEDSADPITNGAIHTPAPRIDGAWPTYPHAHHWRIAEARGATSPGVCRTCGMERTFNNWEAESDAALRPPPSANQRYSSAPN